MKSRQEKKVENFAEAYGSHDFARGSRDPFLAKEKKDANDKLSDEIWDSELPIHVCAEADNLDRHDYEGDHIVAPLRDQSEELLSDEEYESMLVSEACWWMNFGFHGVEPLIEDNLP